MMHVSCEAGDGEAAQWVYFGLNSNKSTSLPLEKYPQVVYVSQLVEVAHKQYIHMGGRLANFSPDSMHGYFKPIQKADGTLLILATLSESHSIAWPFPGKGLDDVEWDNYYTQEAAVSFGGGRRSCAIKADFEDLQPECQFKDELAIWNIPGVEASEVPFDEEDDEDGSGVAFATPARESGSSASSAPPSSVRRRLLGGGGFNGSAPIPPDA